MVYNFFDKKFTSLADKSAAGSGVTSLKNQITQNQLLTGELHKPIIRKFKKEEFILHSKITFGVLL